MFTRQQKVLIDTKSEVMSVKMDDKRLQSVWRSMIHRCHGKNVSPRIAQYYRDKGIVVCQEWKDSFSEFEKWAIENGYKDNLTIDRIDSDKNYCPENCQWITKNENSRKARDDWKRKLNTDHRTEVGHFMVLEEFEYRLGTIRFPMYKVIQTGLYKCEANRIAKELNENLPKWESKYLIRVNLGNKVGDIVPWEKTGLYLKNLYKTKSCN